MNNVGGHKIISLSRSENQSAENQQKLRMTSSLFWQVFPFPIADTGYQVLDLGAEVENKD